MSEATADDAPVWFGAGEAGAWAAGFNAAVELDTATESPKVRVLITKGKHGDEYYNATGDKLYEAAREHVLALDNAGWFPDADSFYPDEIPGVQPYTDEEVEAADPDIRSVMFKKNMEYKQKVNGYKRAKKHDRLLEIARDDDHPDNGKAAWQFMRERRDHEYENYELVDLR